MSYVVLQRKNDWLANYNGCTYSSRLNEKISKGVLEERSRFDNGTFRKAATVYCIGEDNQILNVGASSLIKNTRTDEIRPNLILDNFGLIFSITISNGGNAADTRNVTDIGGLARTIRTGAAAGAASYVSNLNGEVQFGSGNTAAARSDIAVQTPLANAPENAPVNTNDGGYTSQNTVIYQGDANPTGGAGTVNEIISIMRLTDTGGVSREIAVCRDNITPGVAYTAGKLLRGNYTWQL